MQEFNPVNNLAVGNLLLSLGYFLVRYIYYNYNMLKIK